MHLPSPALRCCLLSGGLSRRMGRDKALLPHPNGGTWLEHTLRLLAELDAPITLLTRWSSHQALAEGLQLPQLETLSEPPPWEGPLLALHRLMEQHPNEQLLLCPVDMPNLNAATLIELRNAAVSAPQRIHVAHDGERRQPLLGIYPSESAMRAALLVTIASGERRLQRWLETQPTSDVALEAQTIRNVNHPEGLSHAPEQARA
jgi:molybdopterin-guanine dinucleotide biosynthesis protein A